MHSILHLAVNRCAIASMPPADEASKITRLVGKDVPVSDGVRYAIGLAATFVASARRKDIQEAALSMRNDLAEEEVRVFDFLLQGTLTTQ